MMKINNLKKKCVFLSDFDLFVVVKIVKSSNNSPEFIRIDSRLEYFENK